MKTVALIALAGCVAGASAQTQSYSGFFDLQDLNFGGTEQIPAFDDMGGTLILECVEITLSGFVTGSAAGENTSESSAATVSLDLSAEMIASLPALAGLEVAEIIPLANETFEADIFDGDLDFGGTSGMSFDELAGSDSETFMIDSSNPLWAAISGLFTGPGPIDVDFDAVGASQATGGANIASEFSAQASLEWEISYSFRVIPTPGTAGLMAMGGLLAARRRR